MRLVDSEQELLALIVESLDRLQLKLTSELPASTDLWNIEGNECWPKDENHFSDYVSRHLREDIQQRGIVINREVQIRRRQFTDIHVDAIIPGADPGTYARIFAILEAKGNWNSELFKNMEGQLRDRYLAENGCRSGIYLVGWFSCEKWKESDSRKKRCRSIAIQGARDRLSRQAQELSKDGFDVRSYVLDVTLGPDAV